MRLGFQLFFTIFIVSAALPAYALGGDGAGIPNGSSEGSGGTELLARLQEIQHFHSNSTPALEFNEKAAPVDVALWDAKPHIVVSSEFYTAPTHNLPIGRVIFQPVNLKSLDNNYFYTTGYAQDAGFGQQVQVKKSDGFLVNQPGTHEIFDCPSLAPIKLNSGRPINDLLYNCKVITPQENVHIVPLNWGRHFRLFELEYLSDEGPVSKDLLVVHFISCDPDQYSECQGDLTHWFQLFDISEIHSTGEAQYLGDHYTGVHDTHIQGDVYAHTDFGSVMEEIRDPLHPLSDIPSLAVGAPLLRDFFSGVELGGVVTFSINPEATGSEILSFSSYLQGGQQNENFGKAISGHPTESGLIAVSAPYHNSNQSNGLVDNGKVDILEYDSIGGSWSIVRSFDNKPFPYADSGSFFGSYLETGLFIHPEDESQDWIYFSGRPGGENPRLEIGRIRHDGEDSLEYLDDNLMNVDFSSAETPLDRESRALGLALLGNEDKRVGTRFYLVEGSSDKPNAPEDISLVRTYQFSPEVDPPAGEVLTGWARPECSDSPGVSASMLMNLSTFQVGAQPEVEVRYQDNLGGYPTDVEATIRVGIPSVNWDLDSGVLCSSRVRTLWTRQIYTNQMTTIFAADFEVPEIWRGIALAIFIEVGDTITETREFVFE